MDKKTTMTTTEDLKTFDESHSSLASWRLCNIIATDEDYLSACQALVSVKAAIDKAETARKELTKPLNDTKRKIDKKFKQPFVHPAERVEAHIRKLITHFRAARLNTLALSAAKGLDKSLPVEVQQDILAQAYRVEVLPPHEQVSVRSKWVARVLDADKVPRDYCTPDIKALNELAKSTEGPSTLPGVVFEDVGESVVRSKK